MEVKAAEVRDEERVLPIHAQSKVWQDWRNNKGHFHMEMFIRQIWGLDLIQEDFKVQWVMYVHWRCDPKTEESLRDMLGPHHQEWEKIATESVAWFPTFRIVKETEHIIEPSCDFHAKRLKTRDIPNGRYPGAEAGQIWLQGFYKYTVAIAEFWTLQLFPFDSQDLNVMIIINDGVRFHPESTVRFDNHGCILPDYELGTAAWRPQWRLCERLDLDPPIGLGGVHLRMFYHRHYKYYVWNAMLIVGLVSCLASVSWAVVRTNVPDRLSLDITLLLVVVAFQQVLGGMVPAIAYLTLLDVYVIINIGLMVLATAMHAVLGGLVDSCDGSGQCEWYVDSLNMETSLDWDRALLVVFVSLWLLCHACFILYIWKKWSSPVCCNPGFIDDFARGCSPEPHQWQDMLGNNREWNPPLPEHLNRHRSAGKLAVHTKPPPQSDWKSPEPLRVAAW